MLSKGGGIRWGRPAQPEEPKRAPRRSSYEPSGLSDSGDEEVDEGLLWKMQIRPTKAKGPSYMMAQAGVGAWFFMLISVLMKASGYRVTSIKIDPYLNIDAGTMSPFEHGEVFVLDDGGEADLDLGNYERFNGITLTRAPPPRKSARNSLTAGAIL